MNAPLSPEVAVTDQPVPQEDAETATKPSVIPSRGIKMPMDKALLRPRIRQSLRKNSYEGYEADAIMKIAREGDTVIELGAGIGYISTLIGVHKPVKAIHAFEANPRLIDYIHRAHALNGVTNATVHNALLAPRKGPPCDFYIRQNFLASSMDPEGGPEDGVVAVEQIEVRNINTTFREIKPDVLVCDIEGAEAEILPALKYDGLRAAVIELHPQNVGAPGIRAVFDAMHAAGLAFYPRWSHRKVAVFRREW
ncbi:FkbM family methyltransferase [Rhodalgimonas zhirmunskyi]|uniref:FkbM family methyltransferase n=1 Tax=Rhodalgimonas zhirmunskyi TaxID=2964767 RepID=A0AAJ1U440_9RHOB|nr:FkbM family methyltransferase [Rhodoalgimonas zhirmunskyi]MDQ2092624.1 FkbM family methyltransferase [Rhodoalgimonas zhirmunskyi]